MGAVEELLLGSKLSVVARFALIAFVATASWSGAARAQCYAPTQGPINCGSTVIDIINDNTWTGGAPTGINCPDGWDSGDPPKAGFPPVNFLASGLGQAYDATEFAGVCISAVSNGSWSYGATCNPNQGSDQPGDGPEHVYEFTCPSSGDVTVDLTGLDCGLDLYITDSTCHEAGCLTGSDDAGLGDEQVTFTCPGAGTLFHLVIEGRGFTQDGFADGEPTWCNADTPGVNGNYTVTVDAASPGCTAVEAPAIGAFGRGLLVLTILLVVHPATRLLGRRVSG